MLLFILEAGGGIVFFQFAGVWYDVESRAQKAFFVWSVYEIIIIMFAYH